MRPRISIPIWAALAIPLAAYLVRSLLMRSGDFSLDLPQDVIALVALVVGITGVAWARRQTQVTHEEDGLDTPDVSNDSDDLRS